MKKKLFTFLKYASFLALGIVLLWLAFRNQNFHKIKEALIHADYGWIVVSILLSGLAFVSRAYRWNMLIKPLGYNPTLANSTYSLMVGYFANYAIPRIGEVSRCAMLGKAEKIPVDKLFGTVIAERAFDLFSLIVILIILGITQFEKIGGFLFNQLIKPILDKVTGNFSLMISLGVFIAITLFAAWYFFFKKKNEIGKPTLKNKIESVFIAIWQGILTGFKLENNWLFLGHTVFIWAIYLLSTYLCFFALDTTAHLGFGVALFTLAIGGIGMSAPVQGGIGAFHWLVAQGLLLYGVSFEDGLIFATIMHASQTVFIILTGGASYMILMFKKK